MKTKEQSRPITVQNIKESTYGILAIIIFSFLTYITAEQMTKAQGLCGDCTCFSEVAYGFLAFVFGVFAVAGLAITLIPLYSEEGLDGEYKDMKESIKKEKKDFKTALKHVKKRLEQ